MDLFLPIVLFIVFCVLFSICGWCCKKHREGTVYGFGQPNVTVSSQPASTVIPPYPVQDIRQPQPQMVPPPGPPGPGFAHAGGYQTGYPPVAAPYPPAPAPPGFYPMPIGAGYPPAAPYPVNVTAAPYPGGQAAPYPPATNVAPYPPVSAAPYPGHQQPPSYNEAVGHPPAEPHPVTEGYTKQAPYNPHY